MKENKYIIWSDINLDYGDWKEELESEYPEKTDYERFTLMQEINSEYLEDERRNLDIQLSEPILKCADLGLWNGRKTGYEVINSGNIKDCLYSYCDYAEWFVDKRGDFHCKAIHHDGTNYYLYRSFKKDITETQKNNLLSKLYMGTVTRRDITRLTNRLGDEIAKIYGFSIPRQKVKEIGGR